MRGAPVVIFALLALSPASVGAQATPSVQQEFEAAETLATKGDNAGALAIWMRLEPRVEKNARSRAVVQAYKGQALFALGRADEAVTAIRAGLADLPPGDATLNEDRFKAHVALGRIAEQALDYAIATREYALAEQSAADSAAMLGVQLAVARTGTFVDPPAAEAALVRADAIMATHPADPRVQAAFARRRGLLLLNLGETAKARPYFDKAVRLLGGLTDRTDLLDVSARSDAAIAALLADQPEGARKLMAYSGAGLAPTGSFQPGAGMDVPPCGGEDNLKPADLAVVEFSVGDDGNVIDSEPIYAAGGGKVALAFAKAARAWSWTPAQLLALRPFFRHNARVEMRCSTAFARPSVSDFVFDAFSTWTRGVGVNPYQTDLNGATDVAKARTTAAATPDGLAVLPSLLAVAWSSLSARDERSAAMHRALAIMATAGAPPMARLGPDLTFRQSLTARGWYGDVARPMLSDPVYAGDPQARSALRLMIADTDKMPSAFSLEQLHAIADDVGLAANDPLRVGALIRIASAEQSRGDAVAARQAFERSGLAANQCAIVDRAPRLLSAGGTFPMAAMEWGFEGWTQAEFDVGADGRVLHQRVILSYPPFVFSEAGLNTIAGARYSKSYRPDGGLGCGAQRQRITFRLP